MLGSDGKVLFCAQKLSPKGMATVYAVFKTLGIYARHSEDGLAAQDDMLAAMMPKSNAVN